MRKLFTAFAFLPLLINNGMAQTSKDFTNEKLAVGAGFGFEYGGLGVNASYLPQKNIGVFAAMGYNFAGVGFNGGLKIRVIAKENVRVAPYLVGMYGYNSVVNKKTYYGATVGIGVDWEVGRSKRNYFTFGLTHPIQTEEAKGNKVTFGKEPLMSRFPIVPAIGFKFRL